MGPPPQSRREGTSPPAATTASAHRAILECFKFAQEQLEATGSLQPVFEEWAEEATPTGLIRVAEVGRGHSFARVRLAETRFTICGGQAFLFGSFERLAVCVRDMPSYHASIL